MKGTKGESVRRNSKPKTFVDFLITYLFHSGSSELSKRRIAMSECEQAVKSNLNHISYT